jgi:sodium/bile acid cotransporter 7
LLGLAAIITTPSLIPSGLYAGLLFLCLVPSTVQSSIVFTSIARGNVAGAVVSASISNILGVFITPLLVIALMETTGEATVDAGSIVNIVVQLLIPFLLGQALRPWVKDTVTRYSKQTKVIDRGSILLVVYSAFSASMREGVWNILSLWRIVAIVALCSLLLAIVLGITWFAGKVLGFSREDRVVIVFCGSKKSLASGLPMASVLFSGHPIGMIVLPLMIFHQIQLIVCAVLAQRWERNAACSDPMT